MENKFITIKDIVSKVKRNPLMKTLEFEAAVDYAVECIRRMGVIQFQEDKYETISIIESRGELPSDALEIDVARRIINGKPYPLDLNTNSFKQENNANNNLSQYNIQGNYIFTTFEEGEVELKYKGLFLDRVGYPLIPDNQDVIRAIMEWIKKEHLEILVALGAVDGSFLAKAEQEYAWYIGKAQSSHQMRTLDERDQVSKILTNAFDNPRDYNRIFKGISYD